ncbi:MAG TPA: hypothetical protein VN764_01225, partial [Polyangiaceae bacterium]|nr:hypothetical protein [Polyangiaceae bacterium]
PESVACCSSLSACPGAKDVGVLGGLPLGPGGPAPGWGGVTLDDRAKISGLNGAPTQVISFSATRSELGADARITGNMSNRADVFARERSKIVGNLGTGGILIRQNPTQNIVTGTLSQNANLTTPTGTLQVPQFSATTRGDVSLEPNTTRNIRPGAYRHLSVKSRSTLTLEPGTYWFESFNVEPQAKVTTSGAQPTRIYVKGALLLKESVEHAGGRIDNLLIYNVGTQDIFLEKGLRGALVAPYAGVTLGGQVGTVHQGTVFARGVRLRPDVRLEHVSFPWTWVPGGVPAFTGYTLAGEAVSTKQARAQSLDDQGNSDMGTWNGESSASCSYQRRPVPYSRLLWLLLGVPAARLARRRQKRAA